MSDYSQIRYQSEKDTFKNTEINWKDIKTILLKRKIFILITMFLSTLGVALLSLMINPTYQATSRLIIDPNNYFFLKKELQSHNDPSSLSSLFQTKLHLLQSSVIIKKMIKNKDIVNDKQFTLFRHKIINRNEKLYYFQSNKIDKKKLAENLLVSELGRVLKIIPLPNSQIFTITAEGENPFLVEKIVNIFAAEACNYDRQVNNNKYDDIKKKISAKLIALEKEIFDLNSYKEKNFKNKKFILDETIYHQLFSTLIDNLEKAHMDNIRDKSYFSTNASGRTAHNNVVNDDYINTLYKQLVFYQTEMVKKEAIYGKDHPEIKELKKIINNLNEKLKNYNNYQKDSFFRSDEKIEESIDHVIDSIRNKYYEEMKLRSLYKMIESQLEAKYDAYHLLVENYEKIRIDQQANLDMIRLLDRATTPFLPVRPEIFKNIILAMFLSSFCSIAVVLLRYMIDQPSSQHLLCFKCERIIS